MWFCQFLFLLLPWDVHWSRRIFNYFESSWASNKSKALKRLVIKLRLRFGLTLTFVFLAFFIDEIIPLFGGKGTIYTPAKIYYRIVLYGVPLLGLCMMGNTVIRAEGKPKFAMYAMVIPSVTNLILDVVFIKVFNLGMLGAAWATTGSYAFVLYFYFMVFYFETL